MEIKIRQADKKDLPSILSLYSQPGVDNGEVLPVEAGEKILEKIESYPNYKLYVAVKNDKIIGSFALLIMDNLAELNP